MKLGDFGIARSTTRTTLRSEAGHVLKGKVRLLWRRSKSLAKTPIIARISSASRTVLAEMLLNRPLFPGGGQLAILLAIRDCKIDALLEAKPRLPPGLLRRHARRRSRAVRTIASRRRRTSPTRSAPFESDPRLAAKEIAARVSWVQSSSSSDRVNAVRQSVAAMRAVRPEAAATQPSLAEPRGRRGGRRRRRDARRTQDVGVHAPSFVRRPRERARSSVLGPSRA